MISEEMLSILACPVCKCGLVYFPQTASSGSEYLECAKCRLRYPVKEGIPALIQQGASKF